MDRIIEYALVKGNMINSPKAYQGKLVKKDPVDKDKLVKIMAKKGSTLTETDIRGVLDLFYETVTEELGEGRVVSTPLFRAQISIKGSFKSHQERFNGKKHKPHIVFRPAKGLNRKALSDIQFLRAREKHSVFHISNFYLLGPDKDNFYPGSNIKITGKGFKTYHTKANYQVALYDKNSINIIAEADIMSISPNQVTATLPYDLKPGIYSIGFNKSFGKTEHRSALIGFRVVQRSSTKKKSNKELD